VMSRSKRNLGSDREITTALMMVSQLRDLFLRLPHLTTPREQAELDDFHRYRRSKGPLELARASVVQTGFREAWRTGDLEAILDVGQRVPEAMLRGDLDIQMYCVMARLRLTQAPKGAITIEDA